MNTSFASVVDEVRELSFEERQELIVVLEQSLIDERRDQIFEVGESTRRSFSNGDLHVHSNVDDLMNSLND